MAIRPIVKLGDPVLSRRSRPITAFDQDLRALVDDLIQTMYAAPGVGLAAVQVGVDLRVAVIDVSVGRMPGDLMILINPEILEMTGNQVSEEGCLSVPGYMEPVQRATEVELRAFDLEGREFTRRGEGLLARAMQHELDHMNGRLFLNHLGGLKRRLILRSVAKKRRTGDWA
jgi:peptide deformylase